MFSKFFKKGKKIALILAVFCIVFNLSLTSLDALTCEEAFALCMVEHLGMVEFSITYCGIGYIFCKKYL
ncbi:MAG: hypothetical protein ACLFVG_09055 [Candidatus Aminicenantes bacterium]